MILIRKRQSNLPKVDEERVCVCVCVSVTEKREIEIERSRGDGKEIGKEGRVRERKEEGYRN